MPLPPSAPRDEAHLRDLTLRGFRRHDGLFDIEGRLTDRKTEPFQVACGALIPALELIHDMSVRLTIDLAFNVVAASAVSEVTPYRICQDASQAVRALVGLNVAQGWVREVRARLGGTQGCTHMIEVVLALGTAAFQTLVPYRRGMDETRGQARPFLIDSCCAFASDGPVVALRWPQHLRPRPTSSP